MIQNRTNYALTTLEVKILKPYMFLKKFSPTKGFGKSDMIYKKNCKKNISLK